MFIKLLYISLRLIIYLFKNNKILTVSISKLKLILWPSKRTNGETCVGLKFERCTIGTVEQSTLPRHSVKTLPSAALGKEDSVNNLSVTAFLLSTLRRALDKKSRHAVPTDGDGAFAKCQISRHSTKRTPLAPMVVSMPSVLTGIRQKKL